MNLYRSGSPLLPGTDGDDIEGQKYLLCDGLKEVRFSYFNDEGVEKEEWQSREDDSVKEDQSFPVMIVIVLQFAELPENDHASIFTTSVALPRVDG